MTSPCIWTGMSNETKWKNNEKGTHGAQMRANWDTWHVNRKRQNQVQQKLLHIQESSLKSCCIIPVQKHRKEWRMLGDLRVQERSKDQPTSQWQLHCSWQLVQLRLWVSQQFKAKCRDAGEAFLCLQGCVSMCNLYKGLSEVHGLIGIPVLMWWDSASNICSSATLFSFLYEHWQLPLPAFGLCQSSPFLKRPPKPTQTSAWVLI